MTGRVHSLETFGAVDGPGVRFVVFFQGCPMRCAYCHNPDTWFADGGSEMSVDEIYEKYARNSAFYSKGGITATGGEPMMQPEFLTALFTRFHNEGIHTCLDTSGIMFPFEEGNNQLKKDTDNCYNKLSMSQVDAILDVTDLIMLDIKEIDLEKHRKLTGHSNEGILAFAEYLSERNKKIWIRFVCVPGVTDDEEDLVRYGRFLSGLKTLEALDVLPYHTMGIKKYEALGIPYRLDGIKDADASYAAEKKNIILSNMKN